MVQSSTTQYGLRARALDLKWSKRKVYSSEEVAQPAARATVAAGTDVCLLCTSPRPYCTQRAITALSEHVELPPSIKSNTKLLLGMVQACDQAA